MEEGDALLIHFAIHAGDPDVTLGDGTTKLRITKSPNGCSSCLAGGYNFMQQNPTKASNWARMARNGRKITWIMIGRVWGRIVGTSLALLSQFECCSLPSLRLPSATHSDR
jgi:hypothetical protein